MSGPTPEQMALIQENLACGVGVALVAITEGWGDEAKFSALADAIGAKVDDRLARIQGNRGDASAVSWSDVRLMVAATLRECLALLEGEA